MRAIGEDEREDYRQQEAENRYEKENSRRLVNEADRQRRDPGYVPSWERE